MKNSKYSISFVIPVYKSEDTIADVVEDILKLKNLNLEIILVNDNSPDSVDFVINKLIKKYPKIITYIKFRKNYGQHTAIIEGFKFVKKKYVLTIDDDGQNPPKEVLKMFKLMIKNDLDVVYGATKENKHPLIRRVISKINKYISILTINNKRNIPISNVRLMKKSISESISGTANNYGYIEGSIFSLTDHIDFVYINHRERKRGKSSYNLLKLIKLWMNHIVGYSNIFIKSISVLSCIISILAFIIGFVYLLLTINNTGRPSGWLSTYLTMTFLFSILFLIIGILSEYIGRIYVRVNQNNKKIICNIYTHV